MEASNSFYRENGFVILKNFFPKEQVEDAQSEAKRIFFSQFLEKNYTARVKLEDLSEDEFNNCLFRLFDEDSDTLFNCGKQIQHLISLHQMSISDEVVLTLKTYGLTRPIISTRPVMYFNHPRLSKQRVYHTVDAHQDWRSMQGSLNSAVIWAPLMNIDKSLGALEVLPGSHLNGLLTNNLENGFGMVDLSLVKNKKFVSVEMDAGDALLFSSFLIHRSGNNVTNKPRWSCHFRYNDLDESTFCERGFPHAYVYKPVEELITENFPKKEDLLKIYTR